MRAQRPHILRFLAMSPLSLLLSYAYSTSVMLFLTFFNLIPRHLLQNAVNAIRLYWKPKSTKLTLLIDHKDGVSPNQMFNAAEAFLYTRINPDSDCLRVTKTVKEEHISIKFAKLEAIEDSFEGISVNWKYVVVPPKEKDNGTGETPEEKYITLEFEKKYKETIISSYLPWVIKKAKEPEKQKNVVKLHNLQFDNSYKSLKKESVNLDHPSTFDTLAMDPKMKKAIIDDLDLFLKRREFYRKVGKAWKRGYLLYGPPGTGKSSLIAAMANYLKFDIYDLQLSSVDKDSSLKKLMLNTSKRSIIVIEDIDCRIQLPDRKETIPSKHPHVIDSMRDPKGTIPSKHSQVISKPSSQFSLSGILNFVDGLWSSCGNECIIIFTTNHKERLDPALLRPGRMDVHIHMSYLTMDGFKTLAANYLNIHDHHSRFSQIEELINCTNVTPAEVAEELLKSEDQEVVLEGVVNLLKQKKMEENAEKERIKEEKLISEEKIAKLYI